MIVIKLATIVIALSLFRYTIKIGPTLLSLRLSLSVVKELIVLLWQNDTNRLIANIAYAFTHDDLALLLSW